MTMRGDTYDIVIIGGGPGGYTAALRASALGAGVALVEKDRLGGTCLNRGCIPTKALIKSASLWKSLEKMPFNGIRVDGASFNWKGMLWRKNKIVGTLTSGIDGLMRKHGVHVVGGEGILREDGSILVRSGSESRELSAAHVILASGSVPVSPPISFPQGYAPLTTDEILDLDSLPESLAIIGGGVVGAEFASLFAALGVKVHLVEVLPSILGQSDEDVVLFVRTEFEKAGIRVHAGTSVRSVDGRKGALRLTLDSGTVVIAEEILVAAGRRPLTEGFRESGLEIDEKGFVVVDEYLRTSRPGVHAVGDITGKWQLAHVASAQGTCCVESIFGSGGPMEYDAVPSCIFTLPEIASVGMTERECARRSIDYIRSMFPFSVNGKAVADGETSGFVKILAERKSAKILGTHIVGAEASSLIHEAVLAVKMGCTAEMLQRIIHAHPSKGEAFGEAVGGLIGMAIHL